MLVWLTLPFIIFAVFDPSPLTVCINCSFYIYKYNSRPTRVHGRRKMLNPRPHQQQCRSNIVECYKSNDSFDNVETNWTCSIFFRICWKNHSTCNIRQRGFDIVAGVDGAIRANSSEDFQVSYIINHGRLLVQNVCLDVQSDTCHCFSSFTDCCSYVWK